MVERAGALAGRGGPYSERGKVKTGFHKKAVAGKGRAAAGIGISVPYGLPPGATNPTFATTRQRFLKARSMTQSVTPQEALIYVMVTISAADASMSDAELMRIGDIVRTLPAFREFNNDDILSVAQAASRVLAEDGGLQKILDSVADALPAKLHDTAYAVAVEVAASDLNVRQEELRFLQLLRDRLGLDKLTVAAIERSAQARFRTL